jgi:hypothetical protein
MSDEPTKYRYPLLQTEKSQKKMSLNPLIFPRSHDRDVWSLPSYRHSAVNYDNMKYDYTDEFTEIPYKDNYVERDPRLATYAKFGLETIDEECDEIQKNKTPIDKIIGKQIQKTNSSENLNQMEQAQKKVYPQDELPYMDSVTERFDSVPVHNKVRGFPENKNSSPSVEEYQYRQGQETKEAERTMPDQELLFPKTIDTIYGSEDLTSQDRDRYFQNIQPNIYSYSETADPINANLGISYTPEMPPRVIDQLASQKYSEPLFHRIDPQLVRDGGIPKQRLEELPRRTDWSSKYSYLDAQAGSVDIDQIYDPRFNGYGDEYRSYGDVNLGQVQYYYSDIDAIRRPNFITRSKVDFLTYKNPMGTEIPEYVREVSLNDIKKNVQDQYTADSLFFREDLSERLMRKNMAQNYQLRFAPMRKDAHTSHFKSNY